MQDALRHRRDGPGDQNISAAALQQAARDGNDVVDGLAEPEDDFRDAVAKGAMMVHFRETKILERHVLQAVHGGVDIGRTCAHVLE